MKLVIAEKPSVAQSIARVIGAAGRKDGYLEGNGKNADPGIRDILWCSDRHSFCF